MGERVRGAVDFLSALKRGALVFDGAMGTELYARGQPFTVCFEWLCCDQPELVAGVHRSFREAGARVLTTNSFGANRYRLSAHGLSTRVAHINAAAVAVARQAAEGGAFVLGSMGPTGLSCAAATDRGQAAVADAFAEQGRALWAAGADGILLETFTGLTELLLALRAVRTQLPSGVPVVACISLDACGVTADGLRPEAVAAQLAARNASAIGVNCGAGPVPAYQALGRMGGPGLPLVAKPNAGVPKRSHGQLSYDVAPADFGHHAARLFAAGVAAVGGCCGTTQDHIRAVAAAAAAAPAYPGRRAEGGLGRRGLGRA